MHAPRTPNAAMLSTQRLTQEELCWEAFRVYDTDDDGVISTKELKLAVLSARSMLSMDRFTRVS